MFSLFHRRRSRPFVVIVSALLMLLLSTQAVVAAVTWTSAVKTSYLYGFNTGQGLARTTSASTSYLHTQYTYTNTENTGVYYRRGNTSGSTWGTPFRVNAADGYAEDGAVAAAGSNVYVAYQVINGWAEYDPTAPRPIAVRVNTSHGSSSAWLSSKIFEAATRVAVSTRTGRPAIAATGAYAWLTYTDADTGAIVIANNLGVNNEDAGWVAQDIGATTHESYDPEDGYDGYPVVAATDTTILVAWLDAGGAIKAKISTDNGATWPDEATTITSIEAWHMSATARSGRIALAWARDSGVRVKLWNGGTWGETRTVATTSSTGSYKVAYGTAVALEGTSRVGVAWSTCTRSNCAAGSTYGVNVRWRESTNNLSTWKDAVTVASYSYGTSRRVNDWPSVVMTSSPARIITYNVARADYDTYNLVTEVGRGTP